MYCEESRLIVINPGEIAFERAPTEIQTLLGSCVAITAWNPELKIGGMCHYLLPSVKKAANQNNRYRYGCYALPRLLSDMKSFSKIEDYRVGFFGGGNMFVSEKNKTIGEQNLEFARNWMKDNGIKPYFKDVGGNYCRKLLLSLNTGEVKLKRFQMESERVYS